MKRIDVLSHLALILALFTGVLFFTSHICVNAPILAVLLLVAFAIGLGSYVTYFTLTFED